MSHLILKYCMTSILNEICQTLKQKYYFISCNFFIDMEGIKIYHPPNGKGNGLSYFQGYLGHGSFYEVALS